MRIIKSIKELKSKVREWKKEGYTIGFVPTMGYLHEGHESLIKKSVEDNNKTIVSIFVNPIQFGPNEDLDKYPKNLKKDSQLCEKNNVDIIFNPEIDEMYSNDFTTYVDVNVLSEGLCGKSRPTHFRGVCTVVTKLLNITTPDKSYFGEKDAQQLAIIKRIVRDLNIDTEVIGCPIVREKDGLAKSSRNTYLSEEERIAATILNKSLNNAKESLNLGERNPKVIKEIILKEISKEKLAKIDYVEVVDLISLQEIENIENDILIAIAVFIGKTRLIDNFTFKI